MNKGQKAGAVFLGAVAAYSGAPQQGVVELAALLVPTDSGAYEIVVDVAEGLGAPKQAFAGVCSRDGHPHKFGKPRYSATDAYSYPRWYIGRYKTGGCCAKSDRRGIKAFRGSQNRTGQPTLEQCRQYYRSKRSDAGELFGDQEIKVSFSIEAFEAMQGKFGKTDPKLDKVEVKFG